jgi:HK97 family phage major capsid protein
MRKIKDIKHDLTTKIAEVKAIAPSEQEALKKAIGEMNALSAELDAANAIEVAEQKAAEKSFQDIQKDAKKNFSLIKFFRELSERGGLTGVEADVAELGSQEYKRLGLTQRGAVIPMACLRSAAGQSAGVTADGGNLVENMPNMYIEGLKEKMVITGLGATVLSDLVGTLPVISSSNIAAGWGVEAADASISKISIAKATMTPKRNFVAGAVTKDLLRQTSADVEAMLLAKLQLAHAECLEKGAIRGTGADGQPAGLLGNADIATIANGTTGAALTWAKIVAMETSVNAANANRGKLAYLANAKVMASLKTTEKSSNTAKYLLDENKMLNGYPFEWTNLVPSDLVKSTGTALSAMIFGNFNDLFLGEWGGLDIVIDPYTQAKSAQILFILNSWNDVLVAEPKSFAKMVDIVTA